MRRLSLLESAGFLLALGGAGLAAGAFIFMATKPDSTMLSIPSAYVGWAFAIVGCLLAFWLAPALFIADWVSTRRPSHESPHTDPLANAGNKAPTIDTPRATLVQAFVETATALPSLRRITASAHGDVVEFRVTVDGMRWDDALDWLVAHLRTLTITSGEAFDYTVVETIWGEPDPPGHFEVEHSRPKKAASR